MLEEISTLVPGTTFLPFMHDLESRKFHHHQKTWRAGWEIWGWVRMACNKICGLTGFTSDPSKFLQNTLYTITEPTPSPPACTALCLQAGSMVLFTWIHPSAWKNVTSQQITWHQSFNVQWWCFLGPIWGTLIKLLLLVDVYMTTECSVIQGVELEDVLIQYFSLLGDYYSWSVLHQLLLLPKKKKKKLKQLPP